MQNLVRFSGRVLATGQSTYNLPLNTILSRNLSRFTDIKFEVPPEIERTISLETANSKQLLRHKVATSVVKHRVHSTDTGSPQVQIAVLTDKIQSLAKHFAQHKKDHASNRGFKSMITKRRSMMIYLKRKNISAYARIVKELNLHNEARTIK